MFLSYMAGRSKTIQIGSMVVVLPWHDPLRAAEQISMLDNMSGGRFILGIRPGAGKVEFDGFRLDMGESRERFVEAATMVLDSLEIRERRVRPGTLHPAPRRDPPVPARQFPRAHLCRRGQLPSLPASWRGWGSAS